LDRLLADTGFLIAAGQRGDPLHEAAKGFLSGYSGTLVTAAPVIVETCYFFESKGKLRLLEWVQSGGLGVAEVPVSAYADLARTIEKYADQDIDFTDAALVWLAEESGLRRILTVDRSDFSLFRLKGGKRFDVLDWF
jgi:predicted nucleic acid-binding protein